MDYNLKEGEPDLCFEKLTLIAWWKATWKMTRLNGCRPVKRLWEYSRRERMVAWIGVIEVGWREVGRSQSYLGGKISGTW